MSAHNIYFSGELRKILHGYFLTGAMMFLLGPNHCRDVHLRL